MPMATKSMVFRGSPKWISERIEEICEELASRNGERTQMTQSTIKEAVVLCIIYKIPLVSSCHYRIQIYPALPTWFKYAGASLASDAI